MITATQTCAVCRGWNHTDEARAKIGTANRGRVFTKEHRAELSAAKQDRPFTEAHLANMRAAVQRAQGSAQ